MQAITVAIVATGGGFGTQSFNDVALKGLERAEKDFGIKIVKVEVKELADMTNTYRNLAQQGIELIIHPAADAVDAAKEIREEYPDVYFGFLDVNVKDLPKTLSASYREEESAFLLGALGAKLSKTKNIGFVGGVSGLIQDRFQYGYMAGAKHVNKDTEVTVSYTGSFGDVGKGKEMANLMYGGGADFVAPVAGACNLGVFQAAEEAGADKLAFGAADGQFHLSKNKILASQVKRVDNIAYNMIKSVIEGVKDTEVSKNYGLKEEGVDMIFTENQELLKKVPDEVKKEIEQLKKDIIEKKIKVPTNKETYEAFIK